MTKNESQISLRLPVDMLARLDALAKRLADVPDFAAMGEMSRSKALRLAVTRGLVALEAAYGDAKGRK